MQGAQNGAQGRVLVLGIRHGHQQRVPAARRQRPDNKHTGTAEGLDHRTYRQRPENKHTDTAEGSGHRTYRQPPENTQTQKYSGGVRSQIDRGRQRYSCTRCFGNTTARGELGDAKGELIHI